MEITFKGRQTDVAARFRDLATAKLEKLEKLDQKTIRVDVEVSVERNPRQASQKERVELTILSRGPAIRAEAAAEDRFAALDMALAKLDSRLRRALDRRKRHHFGHGLERAADRRGLEQAAQADSDGSSAQALRPQAGTGSPPLRERGQREGAGAPATQGGQDQTPSDSVVPIEMEGDGPLVVRQKFHHAIPIPIDQALLEMELVGHDFYLFHDIDEDMPSVVYRRHGYQYGVIRLVETPADRGWRVPAAGSQAEVPARRRPASSEVSR
jgi:ribosomal subunit interface protein